MSNIVVTWPQDRPLESYFRECYKALSEKRMINFRVPTLPTNAGPGDRCYVVHSGFVRCWQEIVGKAYRGEKQVMDPITKEYLPAGFYIVRDPEPHTLVGLPARMQGFQGWRYYGPTDA